MKLSELEIVIPTEDVKFICEESHAKKVVLLDCNWKEWYRKNILDKKCK